MKTLEILVLGGAHSGKSLLAEKLVAQDSDRHVASLSQSGEGGVGMSIKKAELDLPSGETIRLSIWDPKTSLKETGQVV
jgi:GTPase SAR1 family protein